MSDPFGLLATAASPVLQAGLLAAAGAALAARGPLDARGTGVMASLCFYVYTPALTFSTLAASISVGSIRHLWPLLANMLLSVGAGVGAGYLCAAAVRAPARYRNLVVAAVGFGNVGNLPLVFVGSLCGDRSAVFWRVLGARCAPLGIAYTAFDICIATLFQFSLAIQLLRPPRVLDGEDAPAAGLAPESRRAASLECCVVDIGGGGGGGGGNGLAKHPTLSDLLPLRDPATSSSSSRESSPRHQALEMQPVHAAAAATEEEAGALLPRGGAHPSPSHPDTINSSEHDGGARRAAPLAAAARWLRGVDWAAAVPLPTQAAVAGVVVGCVPWLRGLLYRDPRAEGGGGAPLRVVADALDLLGAGLIPGAIPLLGAVLWRGPGDSGLPWRVTAGVLLTRLVLVPLVLTGVVAGALALRLFVPPDPMFLLTMLLANATPSAINLQTVTVLYNHGAAEMSQLLFWQYLAAVATLPAFTALFLCMIEAFVPG